MNNLESRKAYRRVKLLQTVELMRSKDYTERFEAEYRQVCIRLDGLKDYLKYNIDKLTPLEVDLYQQQLVAMSNYRNILELRATLGTVKNHEAT